MSTNIAPTQIDLSAALAESAPDQMSSYFLDLEGLLSRIDTATTYYQVLGLERADGQERIKASFQHLLNLLFPPYVVGKSIPAEITPKIERAFQKASQAFAVLASFARRKAYDGALGSIASKPAVPDTRTAPTVVPGNHVHAKDARPVSAERPRSSSVAPDADQLTLKQMPQRGGVYRETSNSKPGGNRRRCERFKLSVPARITGYDRRTGKWNEMSETVDVSRTGVRLRLRRRVKHGTVLYLTLPLPSKLRAHGFADQSYNVYTLVRRVEPQKQGVHAVGVEFIGEHPPAGFLEKPWATFRPKNWGGHDRRRPDRHEQIERVIIDYFDESMRLISQEEARTENVSRSGLRIYGTSAPAEFDFVMVRCPRLKFEAMAELRSRFTGRDGLERICVQLVDNEWPLRS